MFVVLAFLVCIGLAHAICPPPESIAPFCTCRDFHDAMMTCSNVFCADDLVNPIQTIAVGKYKIFSLEISNSSLLYIPHNLFKGASIEKIRFLNSQVMSLSDTDQAFEGLEDTLTELRATDAHYVAQWDWQQLRHLNKLNLIDVNFIIMGAVSEPLPEFKNLNALGIINAGITHIVDYAFMDLKHLRILSLKGNQISVMKRIMLPHPAPELYFLDLSDNELENLPKDFFRSMPSLGHVNLSNNKFLTLPEDTFKWPMQNLHSFLLTGNQLRCDCRIRWIIRHRMPSEFLATCYEPQVLAGKKIRLLDFPEVWC